MRLIVMRHAKSSWNSAALSDFDRPLNRRGEKDAPEMGRRLQALGVAPDAIVTSPALRVRSTCEFVAAAIGFPEEKIVVDETLYGAGTNGFLDVIAALRRRDDPPREIMLFGHNPGVTEFVEFLTASRFGNVPTCGAAVIDIVSHAGFPFAAGSGSLVEFEFPKKNRPE